MSFDSSTPVLNLGPNSFPIEKPQVRPGNVGAGRRWYFLWPVYYRQLLAHTSRRRVLNLFQSHVFRLCSVGIRTPQAIANLLVCPDKTDPGNTGPIQLARRVLTELEAKGAITADGAPTEEGSRLLRADASMDTEPSPISMFQDPWTQEIWPRFVDRTPLPMIETDSHDENYATLSVGTKAVSRIIKAYIFRPQNQLDCPEPDLNKLAPAFDRFSQELRSYRVHIGEKAIEDEDIEYRKTVDLNGLARVGSPQPMYLLTYAISLGRMLEEEFYEVADPFGLGISRLFLRQFHNVLRNDPDASVHIERFMLADWDKSKLDASGASAAGLLWEQSRVAVKSLFPVKFCQLEDLFNELVEMEMCVKEVEVEKAAGQAKASTKNVRTAINTAQVALERLFSEVAQEWTTRDCYQHVVLNPNDKRANARVFDRIAKRMGFTMNADGRLPKSLSTVNFPKIVYAADHLGESINSRVLATLLTADRSADGNHPLCKAASLYPRMLLDINSVAQLRNQVAHAGDRSVLTEHMGNLRNITRIVYKIVAVMLYPEFEGDTPYK